MFPAVVCDVFLQAEECLSYAHLLTAITQGWLLTEKSLQLTKILHLLFMILLQNRGSSTNDDHFLRPYQLYQELLSFLLRYEAQILFYIYLMYIMHVRNGQQQEQHATHITPAYYTLLSSLRISLVPRLREEAKSVISRFSMLTPTLKSCLGTRLSVVCYLNVPYPAVPSIACLALQPMISILSSFPLPDLRIYVNICEVLSCKPHHMPISSFLATGKQLFIIISGKGIIGRTLCSAEGIATV